MIKTTHAMWVSLIPMLILTWWMSDVIDKHHEERMRLQEHIWMLEDDCGFTEANKIAFNVTVTTYNPTVKQCDSTPNITADGTKIKTWRATEYRYVALSRDLLSRWGGPFNYGDYIVIEGIGKNSGIYQVRDTMNPKHTNRVDILKTPGSSQFKYTDVTMYRYIKNNNDIVDNS